MLKHIVMWKFKEEAEGARKEENLGKAKALLDSLPLKIAEIKSFEVGIDVLHSDSSYDLVLYSAFENNDALVAYQRHPEHMKVVEFLRKVQVGKSVVDYQVQ
jgi:hypothetical protein